MLPPGPIEPLPRRAFVLTAMDVPGDYADEVRVRLGWRLRTARAELQPHDQPKPAGQDADVQHPAHADDATEPPLAARPRCGPGLVFVPKAQDETRQDSANSREGPPDITEGGN